MNATRVLVAQHQAIAALFDEVEHETRRQARARLVSRAAEELIAHLAGEEAVFYPAVCRLLRKDRELADLSRQEHLPLRAEMRRVLATSVGDPAFLGYLKSLRALFERHAQEEESVLFPRVEQVLSAGEQAVLGEEILASRPPIWIVTTEGRALMHADDPLLRSRVSLPIPPATDS